MKQLFLIRHAKSDWSKPGQDDFDRPLNDRGKKAAPEMGQRLKKMHILPDEIYSSPAKRAITTARKIADEINFDKSKITEIGAIYEATVKDLLKIVNHFPEEKEIIFIVGHNPGMTDFANYLSDAGIENIPTCGIVHIIFPELQWKEISLNTGEMLDFDYPKKGNDE